MAESRRRMTIRSRHIVPATATNLEPFASEVTLGLPAPKVAARIFWLLATINFFNYLDRFIFVAIVPSLRTSLHLSGAQVGMTTSAFLLVYTLTALPMGLWADHGKRTKIIAFGVIVWSLATWYTAIAHSFTQLFLGRAVLGIGEASYVPAGLALLGAYFAPESRARILSRWGAGTLLGTAVGFIAGGVIAQHFGWRVAFTLCGPPGLLLGVLAWRAPDRDAYNRADLGGPDLAVQSSGAAQHSAAFATCVSSVIARGYDQCRRVLSNPVVRLSVLIQSLALFVTTPAIIFIPIYLHEHFHLSVQTTSLLAGGVLIPSGVIGTLLGGALADRLGRRYAGARMLVVGIGFTCATPLFIGALLMQQIPMLLFLMFFAVLFLNVFNGPLNALTQDVIPAPLRASAAAVILTLAHLLGDVSSPSLVGRLADQLHLHHGIGAARALIYLGGPALTLAAVVSLWGVHVYVRELHRHEPQAALPEAPPSAAYHPVAITP